MATMNWIRRLLTARGFLVGPVLAIGLGLTLSAIVLTWHQTRHDHCESEPAEPGGACLLCGCPADEQVDLVPIVALDPQVTWAPFLSSCTR